MTRMSLILYIEDDSLTRQTVSNRLRRIGHEVSTFESGEAALTIAVDQRPALPMLDLELPGMDGVETLRQLRARYPNLAIVVYSAHVEHDGVRQRLLMLSINQQYLVAKPAPFSSAFSAASRPC
jgi:CheY-like chemotaxis protein